MQFMPTYYPTELKKDLKNNHKPCLLQSLFVPTLLKNFDSAIFLDLNTIFMAPPEKLWEQFSKFSINQMMGMAMANSFYHLQTKVSERNVFYSELSYIRLSGKKEKVLDNSLLRLPNKILLY